MSVGEASREEVHVGKVAVPGTFQGGTAAEPGEVVKPTMKLRDPKEPAVEGEGASSPRWEGKRRSWILLMCWVGLE